MAMVLEQLCTTVVKVITLGYTHLFSLLYKIWKSSTYFYDYSYPLRAEFYPPIYSGTSVVLHISLKLLFHTLTWLSSLSFHLQICQDGKPLHLKFKGVTLLPINYVHVLYVISCLFSVHFPHLGMGNMLVFIAQFLVGLSVDSQQFSYS